MIDIFNSIKKDGRITEYLGRFLSKAKVLHFLTYKHTYSETMFLQHEKYNFDKIFKYLLNKDNVDYTYKYQKTGSSGKMEELVLSNGEWMIEYELNDKWMRGDNIVFWGTKKNCEKLFSKIKKSILELKSNKSASSVVNTVAVNKQGPYLFPLAYKGKELVKTNYSEQAIENYESLVKDLNSGNFEAGRLFVLSGPPGTGKTYMIRSLVKDVSESKIIIMEPSLVQRVTGPEFISFIADIKDNNDDEDLIEEEAQIKNVLFIVEDGERCLVSRDESGGADDFITTMLNITDGIMADGLNIAVLITTNQDSVNFDKAIKRHGRLNRSMEIGYLELQRANEILANLTDCKVEELKNPFKESDKELSLAKVYARARDHEDHIEGLEAKKHKPVKGFMS